MEKMTAQLPHSGLPDDLWAEILELNCSNAESNPHLFEFKYDTVP
jgi:hypothetical protein